MSHSIAAALAELNITLPTPLAPVANYVPYVQTGNLVVISGQLPMKDGALAHKGHVGQDVSVEDATEAAKICAINLLAQLQAAAGGDLNRVARCVRLGVFVNSAHEFTDQPKVANGASDLMVAVLGDAGKHARAAVGVNTLPLGAAVEVEGMFELKAQA
jgi:enamine deaminase RidA (YjgF/YER057c/UK114 family)